jgi:hypothetical protein
VKASAAKTKPLVKASAEALSDQAVQLIWFPPAPAAGGTFFPTQ